MGGEEGGRAIRATRRVPTGPPPGSPPQLRCATRGPGVPPHGAKPSLAPLDPLFPPSQRPGAGSSRGLPHCRAYFNSVFLPSFLLPAVSRILPHRSLALRGTAPSSWGLGTPEGKGPPGTTPPCPHQPHTHRGAQPRPPCTLGTPTGGKKAPRRRGRGDPVTKRVGGGGG